MKSWGCVFSLDECTYNPALGAPGDPWCKNRATHYYFSRGHTWAFCEKHAINSAKYVKYRLHAEGYLQTEITRDEYIVAEIMVL